MMMGSWDPSHPSPPRHHSLDSNHRSPAQAVDKGFPSSSIWLPGKWNRHGSHWSRPWLCHVGKGLGDCLGCSVLVSVMFAFEGT